MYVAIIKSLDDDAYGKDLSGEVVPMPLNSVHMVSRADLGYYKYHSDMFQIVNEGNLDPVAVSAAANGSKILVGPGGNVSLNISATIWAQSLSIPTSSAGFGTEVDFTQTYEMENVSVDLTNNAILIPAGAVSVKLTGRARFNNSGTSTGTYRRIVGYMVDNAATAANAGIVVPFCLAEVLHVANSAVDGTLEFTTPRLSLASLATLAAPGPAPVAFKLAVEHDQTANLVTISMGELGRDPEISLTAEFFM